MAGDLKGTELELAKKLLKLNEKLKKALADLEVPKWENSDAWFAYGGHREKGGRRFTVLDFLQRLTKFEKAFVEFEKEIHELRYLVGNIEMWGWATFWFTLSICRECQGKGGRKAEVTRGLPPDDHGVVSVECVRCGGRGLIEILDKMEVEADEVEAYQLKKQTQDSPEWSGATNLMEAA